MKISRSNFCRVYNMTSDPNNISEKERKKPKLPRITVSLDEFDELIVSKLVGFEGHNKSEVIRHILKKWIGANTEKIQNTYGIKFKEVRRELKIKTIEEEKIIEGLINLFKRIKRFETEKLADRLDIPSDILIDIINDHGDELEKEGLNLQIDGDYVLKIN